MRKGSCIAGYLFAATIDGKTDRRTQIGDGDVAIRLEYQVASSKVHYKRELRLLQGWV